MSDKIQHRAPESSDTLKITKPKTKSVGLAAVTSSMQHMRKWMDMPEALKSSLKMNQKEGFDCPGCAWPDPDDERSSIGEYCENGIKALAEERTKFKAGPEFWKEYSVAELSTWSDYKLGKSGRLTHPMYLPAGASHYEPITWDVAFAKIGNKLKGLSDPNEAIFYTSGRTSNEAAFLYAVYARMFGTNNLPDCSNMCHESSGKGLSETVGIGKGSVTLEDLHQAEVIMVMGQNPGTNHPRMLNALEKCKAQGGKIITVNPLKEAGLMHYTNPQKPMRMLAGGVDLTDIYLQVKVNGDIAFLKAVMKLLLEKHEQKGGIIDEAFIKEYTTGYEAVKASLEPLEVDQLCAEAGLPIAQVLAAADLIAKNKKIIICWAMGLTQHPNGVDNIKEVVNLLLMKGAIGKPGAGTCPVRGHSNVQGDRTMGIWEMMPDWYHDKIDAKFKFNSPREKGYDTVAAIEAMAAGKAKVFFAMGGNFLSATPDTDLCAKGLQNCDLTVHVSTKPNRSHLVHGKEALILPCLGRTEMDMQATGYQFVSVENSMGVVHNSKGVLPPSSNHLLSEPMIVSKLAMASLSDEILANCEWDKWVGDYDRIRDLIEEVIPGFDNYNQRVRNGSGFYLPNPARSRAFRKGDSKAHFTQVNIPKNDLEDGEYILMTLRSHDQYNTTIYGLDDRYRGIKGSREIIMINREDMKAAGLSASDKVDVTSYFNGETREVKAFKLVPYDIPRGSLAAYFPEANPLVHIGNKAKGSHTPASKLIRVRLTRV